MDYPDFVIELGLTDRVVAISRINSTAEPETLKGGCTLALFKKAMLGERSVIHKDCNGGCSGCKTGFGLSDGIPDIPGGFGYFLSQGAGSGFPTGERVKKTPELAEGFLLSQPQKVTEGFNAICLEPFSGANNPDLVSFLVNPDQLSALAHIYNYEKDSYDNIIAPVTSGCASIVRIPLGELQKGSEARAVIGNLDVFSRPQFPADTFFFTVSGQAFQSMLASADESILASPIWKGVRKRIHSNPPA